MSTESFLRLRLVGTRFSDHAVPLELLKDISALQEMIVEVAKRAFLRDNPDRKRSPRGFTKGINLKLMTVDQGSTILTIGLVLDQPPLLFPSVIQNQLEAARDAIIGAVEAASQGMPVGQALPGQALSYFDKIGRSLKDKEALEFANPDGRIHATLTRQVRQRLVRELSEVKEPTGGTGRPRRCTGSGPGRDDLSDTAIGWKQGESANRATTPRYDSRSVLTGTRTVCMYCFRASAVSIAVIGCSVSTRLSI